MTPLERQLSGTHHKYLKGANSGLGSKRSADQDIERQERPRAPMSFPGAGLQLRNPAHLTRQAPQDMATRQLDLKEAPLTSLPPQQYQDAASRTPGLTPAMSADLPQRQCQSLSASASPATSITSVATSNMSPIISMRGTWHSNDTLEETRAVSLEKRLLHDVVDRGDLHRQRFAVAEAPHALSDDFQGEDTFGPDAEDPPRSTDREEYAAGVEQAAFAEVSVQARTRLLDTMKQVGTQPVAAKVDQACIANRGKESKDFWMRRARSLRALTSEEENVPTQSRAA
jgi:hypothetical protein